MMRIGGEAAQIGIVHNYMPFEAKLGKWGLLIWWNRALASVCNHCWGNDLILDYLGTGQLHWRPLVGPLRALRYSCPDGRPPLDWIGLNYYSRQAAERADGRASIVTDAWLPACAIVLACGGPGAIVLA
jgi:hypothetical protein